MWYSLCEQEEYGEYTAWNNSMKNITEEENSIRGAFVCIWSLSIHFWQWRKWIEKEQWRENSGGFIGAGNWLQHFSFFIFLWRVTYIFYILFYSVRELVTLFDIQINRIYCGTLDYQLISIESKLKFLFILTTQNENYFGWLALL